MNSDLEAVQNGLRGLLLQPVPVVGVSVAERPVSRLRNLARLVELGLVESDGALTILGQERGVNLQITEETSERLGQIHHLECELTDEIRTLAALNSYIEKKMGEYPGVKIRLLEKRNGGEEFYCVVGAQAILRGLEQFAGAAFLSPGAFDRLQARCNLWPRVFTVQFRLDCPIGDRRQFVMALYEELRATVKKATLLPQFHNDKQSHFSGFGIFTKIGGHPIRLQCLFASSMEHECFATGDSLQISNVPQLHFICHGSLNQWLIDTAFQILRVPEADQISQSKMIFRYLSLGYHLQNKERGIFVREAQLPTATTHDLITYWKRLNQDYPAMSENWIQNMCNMADEIARAGHLQLSDAFVKAALTELEFSDAGSLWWRLSFDLLKTGKVTLSELQALTQFFALMAPQGMQFVTRDSVPYLSMASQAGEYHIQVNMQWALEVFLEVFPRVANEVAFSRWLDYFVSTSTHLPCSIRFNHAEALPNNSPLHYFANLLFASVSADGKLCQQVLTGFLKNHKVMPRQLQLASITCVKRLFSLSHQEPPVFPENGGMWQERFETTWIETLLNSPHAAFWAAGLERLTDVEWQTPLKLRWIPKLFFTHPDKAIQLVLQQQTMLADDKMREFIAICPDSHKVLLMYLLARQTGGKWNGLIASSDPESAIMTYVALRNNQSDRARALPLLQAILDTSSDYRLIGLWANHIQEGAAPPARRLLFVMNQHVTEKLSMEFLICLRACARSVTAAESVRYWSIITHEEAFVYAKDFVTHAFEQLIDSPFELTKEQQKRLKNQCNALVEGARDHPIHALHVLWVLHACCQDPLLNQRSLLITSFSSALLSKSGLTQQTVSWYLSVVTATPSSHILAEVQVRNFLGLCMAHSALIQPQHVNYLNLLRGHLSPEQFLELAQTIQVMRAKSKVQGFDALFERFKIKEKKVESKPAEAPIKTLISKKNWTQAATMLLKEPVNGGEAKGFVASVVKGLLSLKKPDPESQVFALLQTYQHTDQKLWHSAFLIFDAELIEFDKCAKGILALIAMHGKFSAESERFLYTCVLEHREWLAQKEARPFFKEVKLIRELFGKDLEKPKMQEQLAEVVRILIKLQETDSCLYEWYGLILGAEAKTELGWKIVGLGHGKNSIQAFGCDLAIVTSLYDHLPSFSRRDAKQKQPANPLTAFIEAAALHHNQSNVSEVIFELLQRIGKMADAEADYFLIEHLVDFPIQSAREALLPVAVRFLGQISKNQNPSKRTLTLQERAYKLIEAMCCSKDLAIVTKTLDAMRDIDTKICHELCMQHLANHPALSVREKLVPRLQYFLRSGVNGNVLALLQSLLSEAGPDTLLDVYSTCFFQDARRVSNTKEMNMPTTLAIFQAPFAFDIFIILKRHYARFLSVCVSSNQPEHARAALEVDLALSILKQEVLCLSPQPARLPVQNMREHVQNHLQVVCDLFCRQLAHHGFDGASEQFFNSILHGATVPRLLMFRKYNGPLDSSLVKFEEFQVAYHLATTARTYQNMLKGAPVKFFSAHANIEKAFSDKLPSETAFLQVLHALVSSALHVKKGTVQEKARVLDYAVQQLRYLLEKYPHEPELVGHIDALVFAVKQDDELFFSHCFIVRGILRTSLRKQVISFEHSPLNKWLGYLRLEREQIDSQDALWLKFLLTRITQLHANAEAPVSETEVLLLQREIEESQEVQFAESFDLRLQSLQGIISLWKRLPNVLLSETLLPSFEALLIPNSHLAFGRDRGDLGISHAHECMQLFFNFLLEKYRESSIAKPLPDHSLKIVVHILDPQAISFLNCIMSLLEMLQLLKSSKAFEGDMETFAHFAREIIAIVTKDRRVPWQYYHSRIEPLTLALAMPLFSKEEILVRCDLLFEWVTKLERSEKILVSVGNALVRTKALEEFPLEKLEKLRKILKVLSLLEEHRHANILAAIIVRLKKNPFVQANSAFLQEAPTFVKKALEKK